MNPENQKLIFEINKNRVVDFDEEHILYNPIKPIYIIDKMGFQIKIKNNGGDK